MDVGECQYQPVVMSVSPATGPTSGGATVTITGVDLSGTTGVKFGSTPATNVVNVSATQITATSPAGAAGPVDVTVVASAGTSFAWLADRFSYIAVNGVWTAAGGGGTVGSPAATGKTALFRVRWVTRPFSAPPWEAARRRSR